MQQSVQQWKQIGGAPSQAGQLSRGQGPLLGKATRGFAPQQPVERLIICVLQPKCVVSSSGGSYHPGWVGISWLVEADLTV